MIQPLLSLAEAKDELADTEHRIAQVEQSAGRCVNPDGRQEQLAVLTWWQVRQAAAVAELEAM